MSRGRAFISSVASRAVFVAVAMALITPQIARACSVCFGDPNSDLAKGAVRGVAFMIGVVSCVLVGIASVAGVWIVRARRLHRDDDASSLYSTSCDESIP